MLKKIGIATLVTVALAAIGVVATFTLSSSAATGHHERFSVYEGPNTYSKDVDADSSGGTSAGDYSVGHSVDRSHGKVVGSDRNSCMFVSDPPAFKAECSGTFTFPGKGTISLMGPITFTQHGPKDNPAKLAIIGGTGKYDNASGTAYLKFHKGNATTFTFSVDY
jgi:hypothetical protein